MTESDISSSDTTAPSLGTEFSDRTNIHDEIRSFILQENYPCVAAIQSVVRNDYLVATYGQFGSGTHWQQLRADLLQYVELQRATQSRYMSFWAVFITPTKTPDNEADFEEHLWRELSLLSSEEERSVDWGKHDSSDPNDHSFCLSLNGDKLFVVGLHPQTSRVARRFSRPAMVFNTLSQFEQFEKDGTYGTMVNTIRRRDLKFQGSINPMVLAHGDVWESIQYSGRENPDSWKCPFHFIKQENKPL
ncbi:MAG: guanitoxin biosynthesis heme-dependent pre-guanitoxin N-hydroxylase GntA [Nitrospirota bacterium]